MVHKFVVGPIFFKITITAEVYCDIIQQFISVMRNKDECDTIFQQ